MPGPSGSGRVQPLHELLLQRGDLLPAEVAHAAAQVVRLRPAQARDLGRDPQHLLLEDQHALGRAQDGRERRVQELGLFLAPVALDELVGHAAHRGARLEEGVGNRQVAHPPRLELAQGPLRALRLALEHADGLGAGEQVAGRPVVEGNGGQLEARIAVRPDHLGRIGQHGERADAEEVELRQADGRHVPVLVLGDEEALRRPLQRRHVGHRAGRDDHAARMDADVVGRADQVPGGLRHLPLARVLDLGQDVCDGALVAAPGVGMPPSRHHARQPVDRVVGQPVRLADLAHCGLGPHRADRADHRDVVRAVVVADVPQHLVPAGGAEVEVDIGRVAAGGVQEALEEQVVLDRVDRRDARAVGDERVGDAAAGADGHAVLAGKAHDVGHDEEQRRVAVVVDRIEFLLEPRQRAGPTG